MNSFRLVEKGGNKLIFLELTLPESLILKDLIQNPMYETLEEEPEEQRIVRHEIFKAIKENLALWQLS